MLPARSERLDGNGAGRGVVEHKLTGSLPYYLPGALKSAVLARRARSAVAEGGDVVRVLTQADSTRVLGRQLCRRMRRILPYV